MIAMPHIQKMFDDIVSRILATEAKLTEDAHPLMRQAQVLRSQWLSQGFVPENLSADDVYRLHYATIACHSAVRSGDALPPETVRRLLARAKDVDFFTHCPHGRPVYRKFSESDVGMWFGRE